MNDRNRRLPRHGRRISPRACRKIVTSRMQRRDERTAPITQARGRLGRLSRVRPRHFRSEVRPPAPSLAPSDIGTGDSGCGDWWGVAHWGDGEESQGSSSGLGSSTPAASCSFAVGGFPGWAEPASAPPPELGFPGWAEPASAPLTVCCTIAMLQEGWKEEGLVGRARSRPDKISKRIGSL